MLCCAGVTILSTGEIRVIFLYLSIIEAILCCFFMVFFRDPLRIIGGGIVAVADGVIREIIQEQDMHVGECTKISTFMNLNNVHVNRIPLDGTIIELCHLKGSHLPAFTKKSERNERVVIVLETRIGKIKIIQIAGTIARRIVPYIKQGDHVKKGDKLGLIRLGSRVDVYLPTKHIKSLSVTVKDKVCAGVDTLAEIHD